MSGKKVICPSCQGHNPPGKNGCGRCEGTGVVRAEEAFARKPVRKPTFKIEKTVVTAKSRVLGAKWNGDELDKKIDRFLTQLEKVTYKGASEKYRGTVTSAEARTHEAVEPWPFDVKS